MSSAARSRIFNGLRRRALRLGRDADGLSAVEFALILPLMLALYIGAVEFSHALTIDRRVTTVANAAADLVAQTESISNAELEDIFSAAGSVLAPYSTDTLSIVVTSVVADDQNETTVAWSTAHNGGAAHAVGAAFPLPNGLTEPNSSVIVAEARFLYAPIVGVHMVGGITLSETFYLRPRRSLTVQKN